MAKQTINIGTSANDRTGDPLRTAFQKTNANFTELYNEINSTSIDRSWQSASDGIFDVVEWNSGSNLTITATPFETANAVTYDTRTDSEYIYFVWDQDFIDNVWNGWNTPAGEGQSYSVSLDGGTTWIPVETSGYNGSTFFYFWIPEEFRLNYSFTYTIGQSALIKYNRGSNSEIWFDLQNAPVSANNIVGVNMSLVINATVPGDPTRTAKMIYPRFSFMNVLYDDNTGEGNVNEGASLWSGSNYVRNQINVEIRKFATAEDAGRIYATFNSGAVGTMTIYWNASLYTLVATV